MRVRVRVRVRVRCRLQILQYSQGQYYINVNPKIIDYHLQVAPSTPTSG